ncbi:LytR family transcriptional regulator [Peribacillus deserti]|uniref:LytR family transcriptional regulator n=1 Tax=Peribacillus deserti TaxID=673318 RepID=A0A2N5MBN2_9BACI|nr:LytR family transcriptional regulator [Peribacillus deserti]
MKIFDSLPKSIKKTLRYINQDVDSLYKLEELQATLNHYIEKRKRQLKKGS